MWGRAVGVQTKTGPKYPSFPWPRQAHTFWGNPGQELRTNQANLTFVCSSTTTYHTNKIILYFFYSFTVYLNPQSKIVFQKHPCVTHWKSLDAIFSFWSQSMSSTDIPHNGLKVIASSLSSTAHWGGVWKVHLGEMGSFHIKSADINVCQNKGFE